VKKKQGNSLKAGAKKQPPAQSWWARLAALPQRVLLFGIAGMFVIIAVTVFFFGSSRKEAPSQLTPQAADISPGPSGESFLERPIGPSPPPPPQKVLTPEEEGRPTIQSIRFIPTQPTRMDTLRAEVVAAASDVPTRITYAYVWKVNSRSVAGAAGDTLNLSAFKKKDLVTVTVTPYDGDKAGFPADGPIALI
jgi:hypothetical protein